MTLTRSLARTGVVSRPKIIANTAKQNSPVFFIINLLWVIILPTQASVVRPTLLYISRMLKKVFTCHPERSEGSHVFEKARFFAAFRMTIKVKRFMTHYTSLSVRRELRILDRRLLTWSPARLGGVVQDQPPV